MMRVAPDEIMDQFTSLLENGLLRANKKSADVDTIAHTAGDRTPHRTKGQILNELRASTRKTANLLDELEGLA